MPDARLNVAVALTADKRDFDVFRIRARHLPPNTSFTVFCSSRRGRRSGPPSTSVISPPMPTVTLTTPTA